ncbi:hypothetical protein BD410DRAFT_775330 [Rickenella mellea]|uniref:MICOS complex subunit MIC12 n=1 Tax=Rickenella mellea TaxID=50990 RepID=A0A4Y7PSU2_9AGAM|nr:hypothetical protein BD410DRAFT_775330 [Rickenella mellea]
MSFALGTLSGALVAGGVYYAFSSMMETSTQGHKTELHSLAQRMIAPPASTIQAPLPAVARIPDHSFRSLMKSRWNGEIEGLVNRVRHWEGRVGDWGKDVLYGGPRSSN